MLGKIKSHTDRRYNMNIPIIYFVAIATDGFIYWQDDRHYKTEEGVKKRLEALKKTSDKPNDLIVLYADEFKRAF